MRRVWLSVVALLVVPVALVFGQAQPAADAPAAEGNAPRIACDEATFNFGERDPSDVVEHTYTIRNEGDLPLLIGKVRTSCGCTVASISEKEVPPGGTSEVTARLNLKNRRGKQRKSITVESNDPKKPRFPLYLEGVAATQIEVLPNRLFFGQVDEEKGTNGVVVLKAKGDNVVHITEVKSHSVLFDAELETVTEGKEYRVLVKTKLPLSKGSFRGNVRVKTDNQKTPVIDINVSGTVLDELTIAPSQIVLAEKPAGVTRYIVIRPGRTRDFSIKEVVTPDPDMKVQVIELPQNNGYQIRIDNVVAQMELNGKGLIIKTDVEGKEEIEIPFKVIASKT